LFSLARAFSRPLSGKDPSIRLRMPARFKPERSSMSILSKIKDQTGEAIFPATFFEVLPREKAPSAPD